MQSLGTGQRLITNLGTLQVFDSMTHIRGRHTFKAGASVTFRSREILNADSPLGRFIFSSEPDLELRRPALLSSPGPELGLRRGELPARLRGR